MDWKQCILGSRPALSMILVQFFVTGMQLLSRIILKQGMFIFTLMTYRHVVAAVCVAPFAFFMERGMGKKVTWLALLWLFFNSLFGYEIFGRMKIIMAMGLFYYGLRDTTATYATNFLNLVPIVTFFFSFIAGIEKMGLRSRAGKIKIAGSILCVAGALTISLYKGKTFHIFHSHHTFKQQANIVKTKGNWTRGTFMLVGSCLGYATWYILQVKLFKVFPSRYWATMITCVIASLQSAVIGVLLNRSEDAWKLRWNLQFVTIVYSGALATAATFCLILWTIKSRGPTYPSMFNPLSLIFVAISESLFLGEAISVGSLLGMVMIVVGLYAFLWGKRNEPPTLPMPNITEANTEAVPQSTGLELPLPLPSISHCHNKSIEKNAL